MSLGHPAALLLLALAVPIILWARNSSANLPPARRGLELALRLAMLAALALALADPRLRLPAREKHFLWLVDVSASASGGALEEAEKFAARAGPGGTAGQMLVFDRHVRLPEEARNPGGPRQPGLKTAVAEACLEALAFFPEGAGRVLTVFTDGIAPGGLEEAVGRQLVEHGVRLFVVPIPRADVPETGVRRLLAPARVREGEPFSIEAEVVTRGTDAFVAAVELDGLRAGEKTIQSPRPVERLVFDLRAPAAERVRVAVVVRAAADTLPQNNTSSCEIEVTGRPRVLALSERGLPELRDALGAQGIELEVRPVEGLPGHSAALEGFEALILDGGAVARLDAPRRRAVENFVAQGGGLLALGGPEAWRLADGEDLSLLPLEPKAPKARDIPPLALVLVIDKSGSMQGEKLDMAKSAALAALEILGPGDMAGVVVFDNTASWVFKPQEVGGAGGAPARLGALTAGGGTNLASGLSLALEGLRALDAGIKHVVVLSDGVSSPGPHRELAARMRAAGITLSTVGVGKDVDLILLEQLARLGGGRFYFTDSAGGLPRIFLRETALAAGTGVSEEPSRAVAVRNAPFLRGLPLAAAPLLLGHMRTVPRSDAAVWLALDGGDPLLATRRHGLGQVAAWASSASPPWASEWIRWPGFGAFWAQVLREILPPAGFREIETEWKAAPGSLILEARDAALPADALVGARAVLPGAGEQTVRLFPVAPGVFRAVFPLPPPGMCVARVTVEKAGAPAGRGYASLELRPEDDGVLEEPDWTGLKALAERTGGKFDPRPEEVAAASPPPRPVRIQLWPWLAALALACFLAGLAVRRLPTGSVPGAPPNDRFFRQPESTGGG